MNKEQIYDAEISPLMAQIIGICQQHGISMLATFDIPTEEDPDLLCTTNLADGDGKFSDRMMALRRAAVPEPSRLMALTISKQR